MPFAILFDLDGTLVNSDPIHYKAWQEILINYGLEINEAFYKTRISGRLNPVIIQDILPQLSNDAAQQLANDKEARFRELAPKLKPLPGLTDILAWTDKLGLKRAVVTNAPRLNAYFLLEILGLKDTFATVILSEKAAAGKPDPAPYKLALSDLNIAPESAIAFEDSPSGIRSAVGAGIDTIGIASTHEAELLCEVGAVLTVPDFTTKLLWEWLDYRIANS